jgi:hypothetical protein
MQKLLTKKKRLEENATPARQILKDTMEDIYETIRSDEARKFVKTHKYLIIGLANTKDCGDVTRNGETMFLIHNQEKGFYTIEESRAILHKLGKATVPSTPLYEYVSDGKNFSYLKLVDGSHTYAFNWLGKSTISNSARILGPDYNSLGLDEYEALCQHTTPKERKEAGELLSSFDVSWRKEEGLVANLMNKHPYVILSIGFNGAVFLDVKANEKYSVYTMKWTDSFIASNLEAAIFQLAKKIGMSYICHYKIAGNDKRCTPIWMSDIQTIMPDEIVPTVVDFCMFGDALTSFPEDVYVNL